VEVVPRKTTVHHFNGADLDDLMPFVVRADLVHTGGFGIEDYYPVIIIIVNKTAHFVITI
jgi:hypothetical protein